MGGVIAPDGAQVRQDSGDSQALFLAQEAQEGKDRFGARRQRRHL